MNRNCFVTFVLAAGLVASGAAMAHSEAVPAATPAATAESATAPAEAVADRFSTALQAGDLDTVGALLAEDVLILESGGAERSRAEYLEHHAISDAEFLKTAHVQRLRRTARLEGSTVWIGTESEIHTAKDGQPLALLSTETMVLRLTPAGWRIVHIHWSSRAKK
jgi:ketosteroid isomerase-like protein